MNYFILIILGILPSTIWLLYYLRKDIHPEPKKMILKIFLYGIIIAIPVALLEFGALGIIDDINKFLENRINNFWVTLIYAFFGVALIEETLKYLVVKYKVLRHHEFDEPVDIMIYMIVAALGFAAIENILILFSASFNVLEATLLVSLRFVGATFLHALCSGLLGYFLALSFFATKKKRIKFVLMGLGISLLLHGLFNFSIIAIGGSLKFIIPIIILISLAVFVRLGFKRVKKMNSTCKIKNLNNKISMPDGIPTSKN